MSTTGWAKSAFNRVYLAAFEKALPQLDRDEVVSRIDYTLGAIAHAFSDPTRRDALGGSPQVHDPTYIFESLRGFLLAGLTAPKAPRSASSGEVREPAMRKRREAAGSTP